MIRQLYTSLPTSQASNPHPFTVSVVRTNLNSVTSLANTYKTWCVGVGSLTLSLTYISTVTYPARTHKGWRQPA